MTFENKDDEKFPHEQWQLNYLKQLPLEQLTHLNNDHIAYLCKLRPSHLKNVAYNKLEKLISAINDINQFKHLFIFNSKQLNCVSVDRLSFLIKKYSNNAQKYKNLALLSSEHLTNLNDDLLDKLISSKHIHKLAKLTVNQIETITFTKLENIATKLSEIQFSRLSKLSINDLYYKPVYELYSQTKINFLVCFEIDNTLITQQNNINKFYTKSTAKLANSSPYNSLESRGKKIYNLFLENYINLFSEIIKNKGHIAFVTKGAQGNFPEFIKKYYGLDESDYSFYQVKSSYRNDTNKLITLHRSTTETFDYIVSADQLVHKKSIALDNATHACGLSKAAKVTYLVDTDPVEINHISKEGYIGILAATEYKKTNNNYDRNKFFNEIHKYIKNNQSPYTFMDFINSFAKSFGDGISPRTNGLLFKSFKL
ncbi:hypothetical protein L3V82_12485 [Thiotrichales bacterium 19S3-7]|nr:hypothetical protein [Thiotrichales bacterium 19S3-7]MCF6803008.1 hypothetical protein [Thiotrichales bacterium 19S3-11]